MVNLINKKDNLGEKIKLLGKLFYVVGNQNYDFELAFGYLDNGGNAKFSKWRKFKDVCFNPEERGNKEFLEKVNNRSILPNEVVLDEEDKIKYDEIIEKLETNKMFYYAYSTGSKGYHFHLFYNKDLNSEEKLKIISELYGFDKNSFEYKSSGKREAFEK